MKAFLLPLSVALFSTGAFADTYGIDLAHSSAHFTAKHFGVGMTTGRFNDMSGTFTLDAKNPAANKVEITVKTESVDSNQTKRDQHLRSPDFFDAKQFPTLRFVSERVTVKPDGNLDITGKLTIHGVTKQVSFTAVKVGEGKDPFGGYRAGYTTSFVIKRSEYGMKFMLDGVSDDITIDISLEGIKQ